MTAWVALASAYAEAHPTEVARLLESSTDAACAALLRALDESCAARVIAATSPLAAAAALAALPPEIAASIVGRLDPRTASIVLLRLPPADAAGLFERLPGERAAQLRRMLDYGPTRAGGRADPRAISVPATLDAAETLAWVQRAPEGGLHYVYVVDDAQRLVGVVSLRELVSAPSGARIDTFMVKDPDKLHAEDTLERVARHAGWRRVHALPVVDAGGRFVGALRYSVFRAVEAELGQSAVGPDPARTAGALAELYALGGGALLQWAFAAWSRDSVTPEDGAA